MTGFSAGGFDPADLDRHAARAVEQITALAKRATRFASRIALFSVIASGGGFLLGLAAFDSSTGWIVIGGVFAAISIGAALLARWRVGSVKRHVPQLVGEIRTLLGQGRQAGTQVIETFAVQSPDGTLHYEADIGSAGAIGLGRTMLGYRGLIGGGTETFARLTSTITALTTFPVLALIAVLTALVFLGLSFIFVIVILL